MNDLAASASVVVVDEKRARFEIMKECFAKEVRALPPSLLETLLRQYERLARSRPDFGWQYGVLQEEYNVRCGLRAA